MTRLWAIAFAICACGWLSATTARADGPYEGEWRAGPTRIDVSVQSWGGDCGQRPQSTTVHGGGTVRITQEGDHLVLRGQRTARTDGCWSDNRAVHRVSSSYQAGTWRTVCRTAPADSRAETGEYTLRAATPDRLEFRDLSRYNWRLNESRCVATMTATQTFERSRTEPTPTKVPPPVRQCIPGAAARLTLRPNTVALEPGDRICLQARLVDAAGCALPNVTVAWELERPAALRGELRNGCFRAASNAAEAEGQFRVVATSGAFRDVASIVVRTADLSDLLARRGESSALAGVGPDAPEMPRVEHAERVVARAEAPSSGGMRRWWPVVALGIALLALLAGVIVLVTRRGRARKPSFDDDDDLALDAPFSAAQPTPRGLPAAHASAAQRQQQPSAAVGAGQGVGGMLVASVRKPGALSLVCPVCHQEFSSDLAFCPNDGARLSPAVGGVPVGSGMICPTCRRGFDAEARFCPHDSDELMPYAMFAARHRARQGGEGERTKICPRCGDRYELTVTYCGKDGSELVLVN